MEPALFETTTCVNFMAVEKEDFGETEEQVLSSRIDLTREFYLTPTSLTPSKIYARLANNYGFSVQFFQLSNWFEACLIALNGSYNLELGEDENECGIGELLHFG